MFLALAALGAQTVRADVTHTIFDSHTLPAPAVREWTFRLPAFSHEQQVRLILEARIDSKKPKGSKPCLHVSINGSGLTKSDLLNKRHDSGDRKDTDLTWSQGDRWRVVHAPDFRMSAQQKSDPFASPDEDPFRYVWDITGYVQPGETVLRVQHFQLRSKPTTLVLRNVKVEVGRPFTPLPMKAPDQAPEELFDVFVAKGPQIVPMQVVLSPTGRIELTVAGKSLGISTRTSRPEGRWLETRPAKGGTRISRGQAAGVTWRTDDYRIDRRLTMHDDHVYVADTFTNLSNVLLGLIIQHRLSYTDAVEKVLVAGREVGGARSSQHPSVFIQWKELGVGLIAEDDIFRVHVKSFHSGRVIGLTDDQLGIVPGSSVTLEWSIYPVPGGDYWDFVNAVRRNWGVNYTIPGPYCSAVHFRNRKPADWYVQWVRRRGLKIICSVIPKYRDRSYAHGTGIRFATNWVTSQAGWMRKLLAAAPDVKVLVYFHAQICSEPGGEKKYADALLVDPKREHDGSSKRPRLPRYVPTRHNSYGKALWDVVRTFLDDMNASGLYWDQMSHSESRFTDGKPWDGHTVIIDRKTHAVIGKRSSVPLLMQPLKLDIVRHLRQRGKLLIANTQPATRTMMREKIVRFVETLRYSKVIETHFGCPLALGNHHQPYEPTQAAAALNVRRILEFGAAYYGHKYVREPPQWNFTDVMYPITPVELRKNVLLAEERILTARSGRFGWPDGAAADIYVVDENGGRVKNPTIKELSTDGRRLYEVHVPNNHFAVLVKKLPSR